mmetsp:Transcript_25129/g.55734  ORF Transcript_25129/g.55734 Transcript_25129/m.55734 type:complete len:148 (+) Transcript_25129:170-613(+)|eukprot:CAMPEP_0173246672 /NCGR_PEP_ID=MMETSP1142-20121109/17458_1 /TAXON_ID=483371 /ORGANISM="non described non described, Strain CCMP2298" /LENGTH=147 /DNA_ID=CAMNT_0014178943 /DNA_START=105 /DNA_END=548 /DNA_ORIENTATION=+
MSTYAGFSTLNDPGDLHDERGFVSAKMVAKFCSFGKVTSNKWFPVYITVYDGILRLYDEEATAKASPTSSVLQIPLDYLRRPSIWKRKDYSQVDDKTINFYAFYIMKDGPFGLYREIKLGSHDVATLEKVIRCVEFTTSNLAGTVKK